MNSAKNVTSSMHLSGVERKCSLLRKGQRTYVGGSQQGSLLSAPTVMESTISHLTNPWAHMHAAIRSTKHLGSRQRMDCVVYRRISCIALIMFRERGGKAYSNDTNFAVSSPAHLPGSQLIKHYDKVLASCSLPNLHRIKTAVCRFKGRVRMARNRMGTAEL